MTRKKLDGKPDKLCNLFKWLASFSVTITHIAVWTMNQNRKFTLNIWKISFSNKRNLDWVEQLFRILRKWSQNRSRDLDSPPSENGGAPCSSESFQIQSCNTFAYSNSTLTINLKFNSYFLKELKETEQAFPGVLCHSFV